MGCNHGCQGTTPLAPLGFPYARQKLLWPKGSFDTGTHIPRIHSSKLVELLFPGEKRKKKNESSMFKSPKHTQRGMSQNEGSPKMASFWLPCNTDQGPSPPKKKTQPHRSLWSSASTRSRPSPATPRCPRRPAPRPLVSPARPRQGCLCCGYPSWHFWVWGKETENRGRNSTRFEGPPILRQNGGRGE